MTTYITSALLASAVWEEGCGSEKCLSHVVNESLVNPQGTLVESELAWTAVEDVGSFQECCIQYCNLPIGIFQRVCVDLQPYIRNPE